jgi:hypothetical protein
MDKKEKRQFDREQRQIKKMLKQANRNKNRYLAGKKPKPIKTPKDKNGCIVNIGLVGGAVVTAIAIWRGTI